MKGSTKKIVLTGLGTFVVAIAVALFSNALLTRVGLFPAFLVLATIISINILSDIVGTAATAATEPPFHAMASNRIPEARVAIRLVRNADRVANIANDLIGDVAGTISGAVGAAIVFRIVSLGNLLGENWASTLMVAVIAALTVGGKAGSKAFALGHADEIIFMLSKALYRFEVLGRFRLFAGSRRPNPRKSKPTASPAERSRGGRPEEKQTERQPKP